jgi:hypothetical protein
MCRSFSCSRFVVEFCCCLLGWISGAVRFLHGFLFVTQIFLSSLFSVSQFLLVVSHLRVRPQLRVPFGRSMVTPQTPGSVSRRSRVRAWVPKGSGLAWVPKGTGLNSILS